MRLLVTGHRGLLGSACARRLASQHEILTYHDDLRNEAKFRVWMLDRRPQGIIHCAAKVGGVKANRDQPVDFLLNNLKIQNTVISAAAELGVDKLVFIGTSCLFPREAEIPVKESSLLTGPFEPAVEAYAMAKLAGYGLCKAYADQFGKNFTTVCPSNLYGPGDNYGPSAHVIPALISRMSDCIKKGTPLKVWGDGSAVREFLHADDAADGIGVILEKWNRPSIINLGTGVGTSIKSLVDILSWIAGSGIRVEWDTSQPTGIPKKTFDVTNLKNLGWEPKISLSEGLVETWKAFNTQPIRCR